MQAHRHGDSGTAARTRAPTRAALQACARLAVPARAEVAHLLMVVVRRWRQKSVGGFVLALAFAGSVTALSALDHTAAGRTWVAHCCGERASLPLRTALLRLPGSMLAPAAMLPVEGAVAQVLVVFAIAEAAVGRAWSLLVVGLGHGLATWSARLLLWLGLAKAFGFSAAYRYALDTGPSAATLALVGYLAIVLRTPLVGGVCVAGVFAGFILKPGLAADEHLVAIAVGALVGLAHLGVLKLQSRGVVDGLAQRQLQRTVR